LFSSSSIAISTDAARRTGAQTLCGWHAGWIRDGGRLIPDLATCRPGGLAKPLGTAERLQAATIEQLTAVERPTADHLHWPLLDIDLTLQLLRDPASFPLV
jgi:hypothetical protein